MPSETHPDRVDTLALDAPICIVGAGMTGILAAERLRRLGHRHIDVLEAEPRLGGYCDTLEVEGKAYDFQAHLLAQQDFGPDMAGTALQELLDRYPREVHSESLYFASRSRSGRVRIALPPNFVPLFKTMRPEQVIDQLVEAWSLIERAIRDRTGPGLDGLAFDRIAGETWETFRARHPPLVGQILTSMLLYANMRRPGQPVETVIAANGHLSGHVSQMAKAILTAYPQHRDLIIARMPASLLAQIGSARPIAVSFPGGFNGFMQEIARACELDVILDAPVVEVTTRGPGAIEVTSLRGPADRREQHRKTYARVLLTTRPAQTRQLVADAELRDLFSELNCPQVWTRSYLVRAREEVLSLPKAADGGESLGFWLIDPYASYTDTDPAQSLHRITAVNRQHESPYWVCFSNSDRSISDAEAWRIARDSLFLLRDPELIAERIANWPVYPSAAALRSDWFRRLSAVQGRGGIFVLGEVVSGPTIECISTYVRDVIPRWFGGSDEGVRGA